MTDHNSWEKTDKKIKTIIMILVIRNPQGDKKEKKNKKKKRKNKNKKNKNKNKNINNSSIKKTRTFLIFLTFAYPYFPEDPPM